MVKGFIFDMDGTMFDTEQISMDAMDAVAEEFGIVITDEFKFGLFGLPSEVIGERFYAQYGEEFDYPRFRERKIDYQDAVIARDGVPIKPGLLELLDYGKTHGISMAVATSTSRNRATSLLADAGVEAYFQCVLCGDEIENGKPHPEIFLKAAERLELSPTNCIAFEDSRNGILSAHRAGMFTVLVPDKIAPDAEMKAAADLVCDTLLAAKTYIEEKF